MPIELSTPAQEHLLKDLLAWEQPRPAADLALRDELLGIVEEGLAPAVASLGDDDVLVIGKASLNALVCEGRYLDLLATPFVWTRRAARGKVAHRSLGIDWRSGRREPPETVVARAWDELASAPGRLAAFLNQLDAAGAARLRHDAQELVAEFRDTWPVLPSVVQPRLEAPLRVRAAGGQVVLTATPDLTLGRVRRDECRMMLVELTTGQRRPARERDEVRFHALLATLKYRVPPFRWATYYVAEGAWEAEDLDPDVLRATARRIARAAQEMVRLRTGPTDLRELRLQGGEWCRWCTKRDVCPAVPEHLEV